jgi:hypothetical protein
MDWREAPGQKRMAISSADGSARSVRAIEKITGPRNAGPVDLMVRQLFQESNNSTTTSLSRTIIVI